MRGKCCLRTRISCDNVIVPLSQDPPDVKSWSRRASLMAPTKEYLRPRPNDSRVRREDVDTSLSSHGWDTTPAFTKSPDSSGAVLHSRSLGSMSLGERPVVRGLQSTVCRDRAPCARRHRVLGIHQACVCRSSQKTSEDEGKTEAFRREEQATCQGLLMPAATETSTGISFSPLSQSDSQYLRRVR